jgi:hypothetical protein
MCDGKGGLEHLHALPFTSGHGRSKLIRGMHSYDTYSGALSTMWVKCSNVVVARLMRRSVQDPVVTCVSALNVWNLEAHS